MFSTRILLTLAIVSTIISTFHTLAKDIDQDKSAVSESDHPTSSPLEDFWTNALKLGTHLESYTREYLHTAAKSSASVATKIEQYKRSMADLIRAAKGLRADLNTRGIDMQRLTHELETAFAPISAELQEKLRTREIAPSHGERLRFVSDALDRGQEAISKVVIQLGMNPNVAQKHVAVLRPIVQTVVVVIVDLADNHPLVLNAILLAGETFFLSEDLILRPLLGLLIFSQVGPVADLIKDLVRVAGDFRADIIARGISMQLVSEALESAFARIAAEIQEQFPPPDTAQGHGERVRRVSHVLDRCEEAIFEIVVNLGMDPGVAQKHLAAFKAVVQALVVLIGDTAENHPILFTMIVSNVIVRLIPQGWLLQPFLRVLGFSPVGPVKGSPAAWAHRVFYGAAVPGGSIFAWAQSIAMKGIKLRARL